MSTRTGPSWAAVVDQETTKIRNGCSRRLPSLAVKPPLKGCDIVPDDQHAGRAAGIACAASGTAGVVDAIVVATAVRHQAAVVTSDPGDLTHIADAIGVKIAIVAI
jgi:predicted nucleic acid-binding protein